MNSYHLELSKIARSGHTVWKQKKFLPIEEENQKAVKMDPPTVSEKNFSSLALLSKNNKRGWLVSRVYLAHDQSRYIILLSYNAL